MKELSDTQIALLIKTALDFNGSVIYLASSVYKQDLTQYSRQKLHKDLVNRSKNYTEDITKILEESL